MTNLQTLTDKAAIGFSLLCTIHCLALPLFIILVPSLAATQLTNESFHLWMIVAVLPTSAYALTKGCRQHKRYQLVFLGAAGITLLILAIALNRLLSSETFDTELIEKTLTPMGAGLIAFAHFKNYRLCRVKDSCDCPKTLAD